jgi:ribosome biogenesis GTPase A
MDVWIKEKKKIVVLNRVDMISSAEKNAWANYFASKGTPVLFTDGRRGLVSKHRAISTSLVHYA